MHLSQLRQHLLKEFEKEVFFEGCMPIEVMAQRGRKTMLFGPMKPVGLKIREQGKDHMQSFNFDKMMQQEHCLIL